MPRTNQTPQTMMANEVSFVVVPPETTLQSPVGLLRSDCLPPLPEGVIVGEMKILEQPEPICKPKK